MAQGRRGGGVNFLAKLVSKLQVGLKLAAERPTSLDYRIFELITLNESTGVFRSKLSHKSHKDKRKRSSNSHSTLSRYYVRSFQTAHVNGSAKSSNIT
jgi:hypothetical protein